MDRLGIYAAALLGDWLAARTGASYPLVRSESDGAVLIAGEPGAELALHVGLLWDAGADSAAEEARQAIEERLTGGLVRGPHLLWVPPRASIPADEPDASDFVQRVQQAAAPLEPGGRAEVELVAPLQIAKMRDEGGYASVIGGLSRWWTLITERVDGTVHVNASRIRRAPQSSQLREAVFDRIGAAAKPLHAGEAVEFDASEAWTVQRLLYDPLGERGWAIAQAPPSIDPSEGTLMRRLVRKRLREAGEALAGVQAARKAVGLVAIFDYAEHENVGSFVKSLDPSLYAGLDAVAAIVDGDVRPIFVPRS